MEIRIVLFNVFAFAASLYALTKGGRPERAAGAMLFAAVLLTRLARMIALALSLQADLCVLAVDLALLFALTALALRADRFWPLWLVALQTLGTVAHLVDALDPSIDRVAYAILTRGWSYPMTVILIVATLRHRRRLSAGYEERDWSPAPLS